MFDWVEEGEVWPEGEGRFEEGEDTVEIVDTSRDIFDSYGLVTRRMRKGRQRDGAFYTMQEQTWHVLDPAQGPKSLLRPNIPSIVSGKNGMTGFRSGK